MDKNDMQAKRGNDITFKFAPQSQPREIKIGNTTFIVSGSFNDIKERDLVATFARLIQGDDDLPPAA